MASKDDKEREDDDGSEEDAEASVRLDSEPPEDDDSMPEEPGDESEDDADDADARESSDDGSDDPDAESDVEDDGTPANLGSTRYVQAAFFAAGILVAFLSGKILASGWNSLAEWPAAVRTVPALLRYAEDERPNLTMVAGAVVGVLAVVQSYRKPAIRQWADDVALELSKVTWPERETVTNGTIVVCIASCIATIYIALLDRFWGFVTTLVYG